MSNPFLAEIRIFTGNFAPKGWALCDGQVLPLSQNTALFSLLGTTYGGDGKSNFALPNLQGMAPMQAGQGPGLSDRVLGEPGGTQTVTLLATEIPSHTHSLMGTAVDGTGASATNGVLAKTRWFVDSGNKGTVSQYNSVNQSQMVTMSPQSTSIAGGSQPHNNMMPFLGLTFIIALQGVYPPRT
jgi:microcystin-dependent protein